MDGFVGALTCDDAELAKSRKTAASRQQAQHIVTLAHAIRPMHMWPVLMTPTMLGKGPTT